MDNTVTCSDETLRVLYANSNWMDVSVFENTYNHEEILHRIRMTENGGYLLLQDASAKGLVALQKKDSKIKRISLGMKAGDIQPRSMEQRILVHALYNQDLDLVTVLGAAGTGKSYITIGVAWDLVFVQKKYKKLILTKPRTQVTDGDEPMGEVPGSMLEKMAPQLLSYESSLVKILGSNWKTVFELALKRGEIQVLPLEHMRGVDLDDAIIICDEAQNMGVNQYRTLTTRINDTSRLFLLGDTDQTDRDFGDGESPLEFVATSDEYAEASFTCLLRLLKVERGRLAALMATIEF